MRNLKQSPAHRKLSNRGFPLIRPRASSVPGRDLDSIGISHFPPSRPLFFRIFARFQTVNPGRLSNKRRAGGRNKDLLRRRDVLPLVRVRDEERAFRNMHIVYKRPVPYRGLVTQQHGSYNEHECEPRHSNLPPKEMNAKTRGDQYSTNAAVLAHCEGGYLGFRRGSSVKVRCQQPSPC